MADDDATNPEYAPQQEEQTSQYAAPGEPDYDAPDPHDVGSYVEPAPELGKLNQDYTIPGVDRSETDPYRWHTGTKRDHGGEDAIEVIDVVKQFGKTRIQNGLNLGIPDNQVSMVLGPSGNGQSVLIKLL